jgi:Subtilase family
MHAFARRALLSCGSLAFVIVMSWPASAGTLGRGMEQLVQLYESNNPKLNLALQLQITTAKGDPLVEIHLQKGVPTDQALAQLAKAGFRLQAVSLLDPTLVEGYLSLGLARTAAAIPGVSNVLAVQRPFKFAGSVQSQAVAVEKADIAQARGVDGTGVRVGALSDSYDALIGQHPDAADDVATGDLPPNVDVLEDLPPGEGGEDEGRAILQVIHDVAPGSQLGFATAFIGEVDFSNNILNLRREFKANVIVDDVVYFDEPMFSDGLLAQTVDEVVKEGAAYFSSAGNNGLEGYESDYAPISFAQAQKLVKEGKSNIDLAGLKAHGLAPKSFHNFRNPDGSTSITQSFTSFFGDIIDFQWDEPFNLGKVKTDYNIYILDSNGNFLDPNDPNSPVFYTTDDNTQTDQALELAQVLPGNYEIAIGKMNDGQADHFKYIDVNGTGESAREDAATIWGHAASKSGQAVAAMFYGITNFPEDYSSPGPTTILFDDNGNRLRRPDIRPTPQITGIDGVDTTFFGFDIEPNGLPNFFGTSCAAPDVAAVAALVIQKNHGKLSPSEVYSKLQRTATPVPLAIDRTLAAAISGPLWVTAVGDFPRVTNYWRFTVQPFLKHSISSVSIDLTAANMHWSNPASTTTGFFVGTASGLSPTDVTASRSADLTTLTLTFAPGKFGREDFLTFANFAFPVLLPVQFEVDADRLKGGVVTVTLDDGEVSKGKFVVTPAIPFNNFTGAGLVNADAATR